MTTVPHPRGFRWSQFARLVFQTYGEFQSQNQVRPTIASDIVDMATLNSRASDS